MAQPAYMAITGENQGEIEGSCETADGEIEGTIKVFAFNHSVKIPTDSQGLPAGKRAHMPMIITKEIDRASPMLYQALCEGELLTEVELNWYKPDEGGENELYFQITLENALITDISPWVLNTLDPDNKTLGHMENVSLVYDKIIWSYELDGIEFEDTWGVGSGG